MMRIPENMKGAYAKESVCNYPVFLDLGAGRIKFMHSA